MMKVVFLSLLLISNAAHAYNRIITLNPMISEWTAEILGIEQAQQKIVGVSEYSHYPDYMKAVTTIGPYPNIQVEKILSLRPDLVLASEEYNRTDQIKQLQKLGVKVTVLKKEQFFEMESWILALAKLLELEARGRLVTDEWNRLVKALISNGAKKKVFFQIQFQPLITVGAGSFLNSAFEKIGYQNVFAHLPQAYPKISKEAVLEKTPDEVLVFEMVKNHEDLAKIKSTWNKSKVRVLSGDDFSRCSLRLLKAMGEIKP